MVPIWQKKEFLVAIADIAVSGLTLAAGKWLAPDLMDVALWAVASLQVLTGILIAHFATERINEETRVESAAVREFTEAKIRSLGQ